MYKAQAKCQKNSCEVEMSISQIWGGIMMGKGMKRSFLMKSNQSATEIWLADKKPGNAERTEEIREEIRGKQGERINIKESRGCANIRQWAHPAPLHTEIYCNESSAWLDFISSLCFSALCYCLATWRWQENIHWNAAASTTVILSAWSGDATHHMMNGKRQRLHLRSACWCWSRHWLYSTCKIDITFCDTFPSNWREYSGWTKFADPVECLLGSRTERSPTRWLEPFARAAAESARSRNKDSDLFWQMILVSGQNMIAKRKSEKGTREKKDQVKESCNKSLISKKGGITKLETNLFQETDMQEIDQIWPMFLLFSSQEYRKRVTIHKFEAFAKGWHFLTSSHRAGCCSITGNFLWMSYTVIILTSLLAFANQMHHAPIFVLGVEAYWSNKQVSHLGSNPDHGSQQNVQFFYGCMMVFYGGLLWWYRAGT